MKHDSEATRSENNRLSEKLVNFQKDLTMLTAQYEAEKERNNHIDKQLAILLKRSEINEKLIEKNAGSISTVKKLATTAGKDQVSDGPPVYLVNFILNYRYSWWYF